MSRSGLASSSVIAIERVGRPCRAEANTLTERLSELVDREFSRAMAWDNQVGAKRRQRAHGARDTRLACFAGENHDGLVLRLPPKAPDARKPKA